VGGTEKSLEVVKRAKKAPTGSDLPWIFAIKDFMRISVSLNFIAPFIIYFFHVRMPCIEKI
jgi:hypothetical protein